MVAGPITTLRKRFRRGSTVDLRWCLVLTMTWVLIFGRWLVWLSNWSLVTSYSIQGRVKTIVRLTIIWRRWLKCWDPCLNPTQLVEPSSISFSRGMNQLESLFSKTSKNSVTSLYSGYCNRNIDSRSMRQICFPASSFPFSSGNLKGGLRLRQCWTTLGLQCPTIITTRWATLNSRSSTWSRLLN